ncbi:MAG: glycosyltransferase family 9 protein [Acidimicrobiia bacterium]
MRRRVLVARVDSVGDVLLAGPAVRAVARDASVSLLCGRRGLPAGMLLPGVAEVLEFTAPWIDHEPDDVRRDNMLELVDRIAARAFDQAIVLTSFHQSPLPLALLLRMAGVPTIAAISEDYPGALLDVRHRVPDDFHEVARSLSVVEHLGYDLAPDDDGRLQINRPRAGDCLVPAARFIVVHPGAAVPARAWDPSRHAELVNMLHDARHDVVVTGSTVEAELASKVAGPRRPGVTNLAGQTDLAGLAEVLAGADAVVTGNSGPAHLASAVGTPVVSIYAPTVPAERWRPWGVPYELFGDQHIPCAGCRARVCPVVGQPCIGDVPVQDVLDAVRRLSTHRRSDLAPRDGDAARPPAALAGGRP